MSLKLPSLLGLGGGQFFVDRTEALAEFEDKLAIAASGDPLFSVITYFGAGGVGKTALKRRMVRRFRELEHPQLALVACDLASPDMARPVDALYSVRRQLGLAADHLAPFDFALARLWAHEGVSIEEIRRNRATDDGLIVDLLDATADAVAGFAPIKLGQRLWRKGTERYRQQYGKHAELFEELSVLDEGELRSVLPTLLGTAVRDASPQGYRLVCLLDGCEDAPYSQRRVVREDLRWLQQFIWSASSGLYVLFSRYPLKWPVADPGWESVCAQKLLENLGRQDAEELLIQQGVVNVQSRRDILSFARGNPLALEVAAQIYLATGTLPSSTGLGRQRALAEVVARYLSHLDETHAEVVRGCCVLQRFTRDFWEVVSSAVRAPIPFGRFSDFCRGSYVEESGTAGSAQLFRVHRTIRMHVLDGLDEAVVSRVVDAALDFGIRRQSQRDGRDASWLLHDLLRFLGERNSQLTSEQQENLAQFGLWFVHNGWSYDVHRWLQSLPPPTRQREDVAPVWALLTASCQRRAGRLKEALRTLARVAVLDDHPPLVRQHIEYLRALLVHKQGGYGLAETLFGALARTVTTEDGFRWQPSLLAARKLADLSLIMGKFSTAQERLTTLQSIPLTGVVWRAEGLRLAGHLNRFNLRFDEAIQQYLEALQLSERNELPAMRGKCLTNLAESCAWVDPPRAFSYARDAKEQNEEIGAHIEIGKIAAAESIACSVSGRLGDAVRLARDSQRLMTRTGYRAGRLFGMQAEVIGLAARKDLRRAGSLMAALSTLCASLGAYQFLVATSAMIVYGGPLDESVGWLEPSRTSAEAGAFRQRIGL